MSSLAYTNFLALLSSVANEVLEETGCQQRFNNQGRPLRRTEDVDPEYHRNLRMTSQKLSDGRSKLRGGSLSAIR